MNAARTLSTRFAGPWSEKELRSRMAVKATPLKGLADVSPGEARSQLEASFKAVVVPTAQMVAAIRTMIERAKTYCDRAYPDTVAVRALIYGSASAFAPENCQATCVTGLAGVGKSVLFDAFGRLFNSAETFDIPGHARLELRGCWRMTIRGRAGFADLVHPNFRDRTNISPSRFLGCAVSEAAAQGIAMILPDEFQFITSGSANALMANLLFRLAQVGPPVVYACNFSMVHALWKRPQQDRDRLLLNPIILQPEQLGADWTATVRGFLDVAEEFSLLDNDGDLRLFHDYTYGIKRSLRTLLVLAYLEMRKAKHAHVTPSHLMKAYGSIGYAAMREDVENLFQGAVTPSLLRKDLACPFGSAVVARPHKTVLDTSSATSHAAIATHAALLSMIPPEVRGIVEALGRQEAPPRSSKTTGLRRPPASAENLLGGADRFTSKETKKP